MGRVRFGIRSGFLFLGVIGVAPLAMTANAAEGWPVWMFLRNGCIDSGLVDHVYATPSSPAPAVAAVRSAAQLSEAQSTIIVMTAEPGAVVTSTKPTPTKAAPLTLNLKRSNQPSSRPMPLEHG